VKPILATAAMLAAAASAQVYHSGPQVLTFYSTVDDSDQPYGLYVPKNFDVSRKYPLVVSLHGAGSNHRLNLRRVFGKGNLPGESDAAASRYFPMLPDVDLLVATPLARGTMGYEGIAEQDVYDVLEDVRRRFPVDPDRVYLTGLSMGGGGTLWLGLTRPDVWAAIAPVCAATLPAWQELAPNALNLPVHLFHGDQDPVVPVDSSRRWHKELASLGTRVEYREYPGVRHNSWDNAYRDAAIFEWFAQHRRNPFPDRVRFLTRQYKYRSAYWVTIDGLTPGAPASIEATFAAPNRVSVVASGVDGFTLEPAGHPRFAASRPLVVSIDGQEVKAMAPAGLSLTKTAQGWRPGRHETRDGKRPGAEGPIFEAVAGRHFYVFGTADSPGEDELRRRREQAQAAANWSGQRPPLALYLRVVADRDLPEADLRGASLVLFGTRETNAWIARYAARLPMELNAGAADYGLAFVTHADGRYLLVSSGLSWWTGAEKAQRATFRFLPPPFRLLSTFGDYIVFRGGLDHPVAEGRFDRDWKLPAAERDRIAATGAVRVNP
jgi:pimeloyl-ACP methyl ester carboxylesterase